MMYVNPFLLGVGVTIGVEALLLIVIAIWVAVNK